MLNIFCILRKKRKTFYALKIEMAKRSNCSIGGIRMATLNKCHKGVVLLIVLVFFFTMANSAFAETKVFVVISGDTILVFD